MIRRTTSLAAVLVLLAVAAWAAAEVLIEDWSTYPVGTKGFPGEWKKPDFGSANPDFTIVEDDGRKVLRLRSTGDSSHVAREITGRVDLKQTPILEWTWKVTALARGGDARRKELDDQAAQIYAVFPRFPALVRSRNIGYIWDSTAPVGTVIPSQKTGTVTYFVIRSGPTDLGKWLTEQRNVREDFQRAYGEEPENPGAISLGINTNGVGGTAESFFGPILFRGS